MNTLTSPFMGPSDGQQIKPIFRVGFGLIVVIALIMLVSSNIGIWVKKENMELPAYIGAGLVPGNASAVFSGGATARRSGSVFSSTNQGNQSLDSASFKELRQDAREAKIDKAIGEMMVGTREAPGSYLSQNISDYTNLVYGAEPWKRENMSGKPPSQVYAELNAMAKNSGLEHMSTQSLINAGMGVNSRLTASARGLK